MIQKMSRSAVKGNTIRAIASGIRGAKEIHALWSRVIVSFSYSAHRGEHEESWVVMRIDPHGVRLDSYELLAVGR